MMDVEEISEILHQYHSNPMGGHSGINNTLAKVSQYYIWNGIKEDVVEYVSNIKGKLVNPLSGNVPRCTLLYYFTLPNARLILINIRENENKCKLPLLVMKHFR